jgi:hypothetical protein
MQLNRRKKKRLRKGPPDAPRLRFWFMLAKETLKERSILPLSREMLDPFFPQELENLPEEGSFVLAVNHTNVRWTPRLLASVHHATIQRRPDLAKEWIVITGTREPRLEKLPYRWQRRFAVTVKRLADRIFERWSYNCIRIPMADERLSLRAMREWRSRAKQQPSLVFPEGRGAMTFKEVRRGSGRWLANIGVPVLPVAAWWDEARNGWILDFGAPIEWAADPALHDLQLGLAIAEALPPEEAPDWQEALGRWHAAHTEIENEEIKTPLISP